MHDVIGSYQRLERLYRLYLRSAFPLRSRALAEERDALLRQVGILSQPPLIEPVPVYASSELTLTQATEQLPVDYQDLAALGTGVIPPELALYKHQWESLQRFVVDGQDIVVTTGTGSGKTECFLLPLFAQIARESATWTAPNPPAPGREWWTDDHTMRSPQWGHATRPAAVRGMILYPLNALVEDQLRRLRGALDSDDTHHWMDAHRHGNRVTFGRYTGATPLAGPAEDTSRIKRLKDELRDLAHERQQIEEAIAKDPTRADIRYHFPRLDGGEAWSRWDMQHSPPDILITNYSMLNIMLMRGIESPIFEQTKRWLAEPGHPERQFSLIIDELHAYRGTPGTEVAYILRLLLDRIGLSPDSPKLRIMATTASLNASPDGRKFLREFFGRDTFAFIEGKQVAPDTHVMDLVRPHAEHFADFGRALTLGGDGNRPLWNDGAPSPADEAVLRQVATLAEALDPRTTKTDPTVRPAERLGAALATIGASDALRSAAAAVSTDGTVRAARAPTLDAALFPDQSSLPRSNDQLVSAVMRGYLLALGMAKHDGGRSPQPVRGHLFFHNMQNLWACTDPNCPEKRAERLAVDANKRPTVGKLFASHRLTCDCGARVLDLIVCEQCGEVFLGGFRSRSANKELVFLTPDQPDLENIPDQVMSSRTHDVYSVFWPCPANTASSDMKPLTTVWKAEGIERSWRPAIIDSGTGRLMVGSHHRTANVDSVSGWVFRVGDSFASPGPALPEICPCCDADFSKRLRSPIRSPLRNHRTGFQKSSQVIADSLFREMESGVEDQRKLVVFSDSRQDAAKLAGGMQADHFRDMVRLALVLSYTSYWPGLIAYLRLVGTANPTLLGKLRAVNGRLADDYIHSPPSPAAAGTEFSTVIPPLLANASLQWIFGIPALNPVAERDWIDLLMAYPGPIPLLQLRNVIKNQLLIVGMAPGGSDWKALKAVEIVGEQRRSRDWFESYDWSSTIGSSILALPSRIASPSSWQEKHLEQSDAYLTEELMYAIFSHRVRTLEGLGLGRVTGMGMGEVETHLHSTIDAVIRSMAVGRRFFPSEYVRIGTETNLRQAERKYIQSRGQLVSDVTGILTTKNVAEPSHHGLALRSEALAVIPASVEERQSGYACPRCTAFFLQDVGFCPYCPGSTKLDYPAKPGDFDYYVELVRSGQTRPFRMNCEELTGQTDPEERPKRQRWFQEVFVGDEIPRVQGIDLLSVTTTMEAGVDIGALNAVMLANMPPRRFNYQQRVGRAGRRAGGVSLAVTFCRGRSHDDFYFQRPEEITGDPPPAPYIDLRSDTIFDRVLTKEVLRRAFETLKVTAETSESVHGEFGRTDEWTVHEPAIKRWLSMPKTILELENLIVRLSLETPWGGTSGKVKRENKLAQLSTTLLGTITKITESDDYLQESLSERLANAGLLPMFGFPTRVRNLFTSWPSSGRQWPPKGSIDRDLDIAISQFAPLSQTIKDKLVHTAIGVASFTPQGRDVKVSDGFVPPLAEENPHEVGLCRNCQAVVRFGPSNPATVDCPVCKHLAALRVVDAREPKDFFTDLEREDFEGQFEWRPRSTRPSLGITVPPDDQGTQSGNARSIFVREQILSINDDGGAGGFDFRPVRVNKQRQHGAYAIAKSISTDEEVSPSGRFVSVEGTGRRVALLAQRMTDVMLFDVDAWPVGVVADPQSVEGRAAWYSLAFWLRLAAGQMLDIDTNELQAGFRSLSRNGQAVGQAFLADQLENGAGYCRELATPDRLQQLLEQADVTRTGSIASKWASSESTGFDHFHHTECDTSCNRCLRDFNNLPYHGLLDWRLALEMARLAAAGITPNLIEPWANGVDNPWRRLTENETGTAPVQETLRRLGFGNRTELGSLLGYKSVRDDLNKVIVVRHPLWTDDHSDCRTADAFARQRFGDRVEIKHLSPFRILRRPVDCL